MANKNEELIQCPYDRYHQIRRQKFHVHLGRCSKNHPNTPKVPCPIDSTHIVNEPELEFHVKQCPSRASYENLIKVDEPAVRPREESEQLEDHPGHSTSGWDEEDVETYNPEAHSENANVLRSLPGATRSARREFRRYERSRLLKIRQK